MPRSLVWNTPVRRSSLAGVVQEDVADRGAERPDAVLLDAPVSGSRDPAKRGQLTIFASGPGEARPRVAPLFDALGPLLPGAGGPIELTHTAASPELASGHGEQAPHQGILAG